MRRWPYEGTEMGRTLCGVEAEIRTMGVKPRTGQLSPEARERHGTDSPSEPSEESNPVDTLIWSDL